MQRIKYINFMMCVTLCIHAKESCIVTNNDAGFFSNFLIAIGALDAYERGMYASLKIDYDNEGLYYDPARGRNWWTYYFEPIELGIQNAKYKKITRKEFGTLADNVLITMQRERAAYLVQKYIHIKPHIKNKIDRFVYDNFADSFVIGLHYRATDQVENPPATYEEVFAALDAMLKVLSLERYKIFVATDAQGFLDALCKRYSCVVYTQSYRCKDRKGIHLDVSFDNYTKGEEALIDAVLLSKTNVLMRVGSNLSFTSKLFNATLPVFEINISYDAARHGVKPLRVDNVALMKLAATYSAQVVGLKKQ